MPARRAHACFAAVALLLSSHLLLAQATATPPQDPSTQSPPPQLYTLHVYANLAQVPTAVINPDGRPFPRLTPSQFFVSLDGGPQFHPSQLRIEGDDAISLAIIIDDSGTQTHFISGIADTLSKLAPKDLHPKDHVSIYAIDCKAVQSVDDVSATADVIRKGVTSVLSTETLHGDKHRPSCSSSVHLWDALAYAINKLADTPSRRVVLLVSLGMDSGSTITQDQVVHLAQGASTAVFGMRDIEEFAFQRTFHEQTASGLNGNRTGGGHDHLSSIAQRTGGLVFDDQHIQIEDQLHRFIGILRSRYIVEFPRPDKDLPGEHQIAISIPSKWNFLVRFTGASLPLADPALLNDPNTVPSAPSPATFGNKPPLPLPKSQP